MLKSNWCDRERNCARAHRTTTSPVDLSSFRPLLFQCQSICRVNNDLYTVCSLDEVGLLTPCTYPYAWQRSEQYRQQKPKRKYCRPADTLSLMQCIASSTRTAQENRRRRREEREWEELVGHGEAVLGGLHQLNLMYASEGTSAHLTSREMLDDYFWLVLTNASACLRSMMRCSMNISRFLCLVSSNRNVDVCASTRSVRLLSAEDGGNASVFARARLEL